MDTLKILSFLQEGNLFTDDKSLRNIETGVTAESSVNVDQAKEIGMMIIESMAGKNILDYTFKKSNHAITLSVKSAIKVCGESVQVDPQLLFQRLITVFNDFFEDKSEIFKYELCSFPPPIFDASGFPREAHKPKLADAIWALGECGVPAIESSVIQYVLDGGSLLQLIPWPKANGGQDVVLVGEDIDLLVLLCYNADSGVTNPKKNINFNGPSYLQAKL